MPPEQAFAPIARIGGRTGWYYGDWLWRLRGFLDLLVGGVGVRRGRRDPDTAGAWRHGGLVACRGGRAQPAPPSRGRDAAPGRAWLQFEVAAHATGSTITQTAIFDPVGLLGLAYWYALYPLHGLVFSGMLRGIGRAAERERATAGSKPSEVGGGGRRP